MGVSKDWWPHRIYQSPYHDLMEEEAVYLESPWFLDTPRFGQMPAEVLFGEFRGIKDIGLHISDAACSMEQKIVVGPPGRDRYWYSWSSWIQVVKGMEAWSLKSMACIIHNCYLPVLLEAFPGAPPCEKVFGPRQSQPTPGDGDSSSKCVNGWLSPDNCCIESPK